MEVMTIRMVSYCLFIIIIIIVIIIVITILIYYHHHSLSILCWHLWVPGLAFMAEGLIYCTLCAVKEAAPLQKVQDGREEDDRYAHEKH